MDDDIYWKLKAPPPTPDDEMCRCPGRPPIKLAGGLGANPMSCLKCNLEVAPEAIGLPSDLVEELVSWSRLYGAVYYLWLDSAEYEEWARAELSSSDSAINQRGAKVTSRIDSIVPCFFWWFAEVDEEGAAAISGCPVCGGAMVRYDPGILPQRLCSRCRVVSLAPAENQPG